MDRKKLEDLRAKYPADKPDASHHPEFKKAIETVFAGTDRRHLRATGRNEQWNIRCRAGLKDQIEQIAQERDLSIAALVEEVLDAFIATLSQPLKNGADHA